ncbi:dTMP kinase [Candidatus Woesearchaeota archaeon]|nr:dTMP kinase [Candidatus Woesearchaeota archaeon]
MNESSRPMRGYFIVFDGPDKCGKSTQHRLLCDYLFDHPADTNKFIQVLRGREPHNTPQGLEIRRRLENREFDNETFFELFVGDRKTHVQNTILPNMNAGTIVALDRYYFATWAYQVSNGVSKERFWQAHKGMPVPDITFFIDTPADVRLKRMGLCGDGFDTKYELQKRLDGIYKDMVGEFKDHNIHMINGNRPPTAVFEDIKKYIDALIFPQVKQ